MTPLARELARKLFHLLGLLYLLAYELVGWPRLLAAMALWTLLVAVVETWRLASPRLNRFLAALFSGLFREDEKDKYTGLMHTTLGTLILWLAFGRYRTVVYAAMFYLAFGDASAALVGRAFGRHRLGGGRKTVEGSAACFLACALVGAALGLPAAALLIGAAT
ncbi:MAG: hypothetical protein KGK30_08485, partial [Elusimicrobia bacterium]|nr:hypothetical protein [Elusimicrobiota bacterium]